MRLLRLGEVRQAQTLENDQKLAEKTALQAQLKKYLQCLNELRLEHAKQKLALKEDLERCYQQTQKEKQALQGEVASLETRKQQLLQDLDEKKRKELLQEVIVREQTLAEKERISSQREEALIRLQGEIEQREQLLKQLDDNLLHREVSMNEAEEHLKAEHASLRKIENESWERLHETSENLREEKNRLEEREKAVHLKALMTEATEKIMQEKTIELEQRELAISSRQLTLRAAFDEARRKGLL